MPDRPRGAVRGRVKAAVALAAWLAVAAMSPAAAEDADGVDLTAAPSPNEETMPAELTGTLKKVHESGVVTIGFREASFPFSFARPGSPDPLGYSIDLCQGVVAEIARELNGIPIKVAYQRVTAETRMDAVVSGKVDLECGSTTSNIERQKSVAFSPIIYVAGTKLLVKRGSSVASYHDLTGRVLVVTAGTTNEAAMKLLNDKYKLGITIVSAKDHDESYGLLADGKADAFATDDVLLSGFVSAKKAEATMAVVGDFITYEPYGIMFRKNDPLLAAAVTRAFTTMAQTRALFGIYKTWFLQRTPTGELLNLPISPQLAETFRVLGAGDF
jgi:glutamate/aspartate transport system substrate-binding protein